VLSIDCEVDNQLEEKYIHEDFVCMHDSWETIKKIHRMVYRDKKVVMESWSFYHGDFC
jgi:hypothetical protein